MDLSKCDIVFILCFTFIQLTVILKYNGDAKKCLIRGATFECMSLFGRVARIFSRGVRNRNLKISSEISLRYRMVIRRKKTLSNLPQNGKVEVKNMRFLWNYG